MTDNNVIKLAQPGTFIDSLTEILRSGARALLTQVVEAEVADFLHRHCDLKTDTGRRRVVRHGHSGNVGQGRKAARVGNGERTQLAAARLNGPTASQFPDRLALLGRP